VTLPDLHAESEIVARARAAGVGVSPLSAFRTSGRPDQPPALVVVAVEVAWACSCAALWPWARAVSAVRRLLEVAGREGLQGHGAQLGFQATAVGHRGGAETLGGQQAQEPPGTGLGVEIAPHAALGLAACE
jgi:hypothetical protein